MSLALQSSYEPNYKIEPTITPEDQNVLDQISSLLPHRMELAYEILESHLAKKETAPIAFIAGTFALQLGNNDSAINKLTAATRLFAPFQRAHKNLGLAYLQQDEYSLSLKHLQNALELGANDSVVYSAIGFCYLQQDRLNSAENAYRMALVRDSESSDVQKGLITALSGQGRSIEALALINEILNKNPLNREFWLSKVSTFSGTDKKVEMLVTYECLKRLVDYTPMDLLRIGDLLLSQSMPQKALSYYKESLQNGGIEPKYAIRSMGRLASYGYYNEANILGKDVEFEYQDYLNQEELLSIKLVQAKNLIEEENIKSAENLLKSVQKLDPLNGEALLLLAGIYKDQDIALSISYLERVKKMDEFKDQANLELGRIYADRRDWEQSLQSLRAIENRSNYSGLEKFMNTIEKMRGF